MLSSFLLDSRGQLLHNGRQHNVDAAHDGAVFGLGTWFNRIGDRKGMLWVATCSDDRTVRLWELHDCSLTQVNPIKKLTWTWAHESRIWNVQFVLSGVKQNTGLTLPYLVSVGEDAACNLWQIAPSAGSNQHNGENEPDLKIEHMSQMIHHSGKNIWSVDYGVTAPDRLLLITGGADGAIETWNLGASLWERLSLTRHDQRLSELSIPPPSSYQRVKNFCWLNCEVILVITDGGGVWWARFTDDKPGNTAWDHIGNFEALNSYCVVVPIIQLAVALLGGTDNTVYICSKGHPMLQELCTVPGKILSLLASSVSEPDQAVDTPSSRPSRFVWLATWLKQDSIVLFEGIVEANGNTKCNVLARLALTESNANPTILFALAEKASISQILLGCRDGTFYVYTIKSYSSVASALQIEM